MLHGALGWTCTSNARIFSPSLYFGATRAFGSPRRIRTSLCWFRASCPASRRQGNMVEMLGFAPRLTVPQTGVLTFTLQPRWYHCQELNLSLVLRRDVLYPFHYSGMVRPVGFEPTVYCFEGSCFSTKLWTYGGRWRGSNFQGLIQPRRFSRAVPSPAIGLTFRNFCGGDETIRTSGEILPHTSLAKMHNRPL